MKQPGNVHDESEALRLIDQGSALLRAGELDQAEAAFQVAREIAGSPAAFDGLGCVAFLRGQAQTAEKFFILATELDPNYQQAVANLALLYESRGLRAKAHAVYKSAIQNDPQNFRARNNYAAFLYSTRADPSSRAWAHQELLKAQALVAHPLIHDNITRQGEP